VKKITFNNCLKNMETKELYFKETTGEVIAFKGFEEFSFALCKGERGLWKVIETSVGVGISFGETKADAKKQAETRLKQYGAEKYRNGIEKAKKVIAQFGGREQKHDID
jgi:hypothetical protein